MSKPLPPTSRHLERVHGGRCVDAIVDPDKVLSTEFERVFAGVFDTVELSLHRDIDMDELIDSIEARRSDQICVDYKEDENISSCLVTIKGHDVWIKIAGATFSVVHHRATTPNLLLKSLVDVQLALTDTHHVLTIPFKPPNC